MLISFVHALTLEMYLSANCTCANPFSAYDFDGNVRLGFLASACFMSLCLSAVKTGRDG